MAKWSLFDKGERKSCLVILSTDFDKAVILLNDRIDTCTDLGTKGKLISLRNRIINNSVKFIEMAEELSKALYLDHEQ